MNNHDAHKALRSTRNRWALPRPPVRRYTLGDAAALAIAIAVLAAAWKLLS